MACKNCEYWRYIGPLEQVYQYKDKHNELPETYFKELPAKGSDDNGIYGYCKRTQYAAIKNYSTTCNQYIPKKNDEY